MFGISCPRCNGGNAECELCGGTGAQALYRCPAAHNTRDLDDAFFAYGLVESGVWPVVGGLVDQCAAFVEFVRVVNAERSAIDAEQRKRDELARR